MKIVSTILVIGKFPYSLRSSAMLILQSKCQNGNDYRIAVLFVIF
ncbi:MAG: hypothetical protein ACMUJM_18465 [bacterium]